MTTQSLTRSLKTDEITVMSHVTSLTASANRISKLKGDEPNSSTIHLNFEVINKKENEPCILANAEELGFIVNPKDALEIGLSLVAMAKEEQSPEIARAIEEILSKLENTQPVASI